MKIKCPHCRKELRPEDINISRNTGYCPDCRELFQLSGLLDSQADSTAAAEDDQVLSRGVPSGTRVLCRGNTVVVSTHYSRLVLCFLLPFTLVWSGMSLGGIYGPQIVHRQFNPAASLGGLPFLLGTLFLGALIVYTLFGKVVLWLNDDGVTFQRCCLRAPVHEYDIPDDSSYDRLAQSGGSDNAPQHWWSPRHWSWNQLRNVVIERSDRRRSLFSPAYSSSETLSLPYLPEKRRRFLIAMLRQEARRRRLHLNVIQL